jgi:drug/metabolite transporter (DMT)-like permease
LAGTILVILGIILVSRTTDKTSPEALLRSPTRRKGLLLALLVSILWAGGQIALKPGTEGINSVVANSIRLPLGALVMLALTVWRRQGRSLRRLDGKSWGIILFSSVVGTGLGSLFFVYAIQLAGAGRTSVLVSISPLLALPFSMMWLQERPTRWTLAGTLLTTAGIALVA